MLALLLGCTCPTFEEMEVVAVDATATPERIATVREALADFAAWTGDVGVCVPEIHLQADLLEPIGTPDDVVVGAQYAGDHNPIRIDTGFPDLRGTTFHELCHATSRREGHATARDWPQVADRALVGEDHVVEEDFAEACEGGPVDVTIDAALAAACGTEPELGEGAHYLAEVVFPAAPRPDWSDTTYAYTERSAVWEGLDYDAVQIHDARVVGDEVLLLVVADWEVHVVAFDRALSEARWQTQLTEWIFPNRLRFVDADAGTWVALNLLGDPDSLVELDGARVVRALTPDRNWTTTALALVGGILYEARDGTLYAWPLDGDAVALDPPAGLFPNGLDVGALWVEDGRLAFFVPEGLGRFDPVDGMWSLEPAIGNVTLRVALGDGRALVRTWGSPQRWFVLEDGAYAFLGDPCGATPDIGNPYLQFGLDGRLAWFDLDWDDTGLFYALHEVTLTGE